MSSTVPSTRAEKMEGLPRSIARSFRPTNTRVAGSLPRSRRRATASVVSTSSPTPIPSSGELEDSLDLLARPGHRQQELVGAAGDGCLDLGRRVAADRVDPADDAGGRRGTNATKIVQCVLVYLGVCRPLPLALSGALPVDDDPVHAGRDRPPREVRVGCEQEELERAHRTTLTIASTTRSAALPSTSPTTSRTARRRSSASSPGSASDRSIPATTSSKLSAVWNAPEAASSL